MTNLEEHDYYKILGVRRDASKQEIEVAIARLQRMSAPEHNKSVSPSIFRIATEMQRVLLVPSNRKEYDDYLSMFDGMDQRDKYGQKLPSYAGGAKRLNEDGGPFLPQLVPPPPLKDADEIRDIKTRVENKNKLRKPWVSPLTKLSRSNGSLFIPNKTIRLGATILSSIAILYYIITSFIIANLAESLGNDSLLFVYYGSIAITILTSFLALRSHVTLKKPYSMGYAVVFLVSILSAIALWMIEPDVAVLSIVPIVFIYGIAYTLRGRFARKKHTLYNFPLDIMENSDREYGIPGEGILNSAREGKKTFTSVQQQAFGETLTGEMIAPLLEVYPTMQIIHDLHIKGITSGHINHAIVVGDKILYLASKLYEPASYSLDRWGNLHKLRFNGKSPEPTHRSLSFGKSVDFMVQHNTYSRSMGLIVVHASLSGEIELTGDDAAHIDICNANGLIEYIVDFFADARQDLYDGRVMAEVMRYYQPVETAQTEN